MDANGYTGDKMCPKCGKFKLVSEFGVRTNQYGRRKLQSYCVICRTGPRKGGGPAAQSTPNDAPPPPSELRIEKLEEQVEELAERLVRLERLLEDVASGSRLRSFGVTRSAVGGQPFPRGLGVDSENDSGETK